MARRTLGIAAGVVLLSWAFPMSALAQSDGRTTQKSSDNDDTVPRRIQPPVRQVQAPAPTRHRSDATHKSSHSYASRKGKHVTVRYPVDTPENIRMRADMQTFYLPHGVVMRFDPYSSQWAMEGAYLARGDKDRKNLERLYNYRDMQERKQRVLNAHEQALQDGLDSLADGDVAQAIVSLTLAAKLNQGDPACRVHLAQARLAYGHYEEAGKAIRRALELQPKLVYINLDLDKYYAEEGSLEKYTDALRDWLKENPASSDVYFLLGYLDFQQGKFDAAHTSFSRVAKVSPRDDLTRSFLSVTKPAAE